MKNYLVYREDGPRFISLDDDQVKLLEYLEVTRTLTAKVFDVTNDDNFEII